MIADKYISDFSEDINIRVKGYFYILLNEIESLGLKVDNFYKKEEKWFFFVTNARVLSSKKTFLINMGYNVEDGIISK